MSGSWQELGQSLYLELLHANFLELTGERRSRFCDHLLDAATRVRNQEHRDWLEGGSWREMLVASWLIGLREEGSLRDLVHRNLLASRTSYAGQGLCFATARFRDELSVQTLTEYLDQYLPVDGREYEQQWAIGSLAWLDSITGSAASERFLDRSLWRVTAGSKPLATWIRLTASPESQTQWGSWAAFWRPRANKGLHRTGLRAAAEA
jgi:hypothetical protein